MFVIRNYVTTGGTVACALAIGYLMQNGPASQPDVQETRHAMIQPSGEGTVIAGLEGIVLTSATPNASTAPEPSAKVPPRAEPAVPQAQVNCDLRARAVAAPNATSEVWLRSVHGTRSLSLTGKPPQSRNEVSSRSAHLR